MAKKPDGMGTLNTTPGSCVDVPCTPNLTVTYRVRSSCDSLPYALEVNGKIPEAFKNRALGVKCDGKSEIKHPAKPGDRFALYLNSDAHPDFRQQKVYAITVGDNDLVVTISEKTGKHADSDAPKLAETQVVRDAQGAERTIDFYTAPLTGDIWMKISHKYTVAEVNAMLPSTTGKAECEAVRKFYDGSLNKKNCAIDVARPAQSDSPARQTRIIVGTGADTNPLANIQSFELFRDGLPRVHPWGYLALIDAALDTGAEQITMSSTWRPVLGSIAHRAGLGLDVNYIEKTHLNREELRGQGSKDGNVSAEEKTKFKEKEQADKNAAAAQARLKQLEKERDALVALKKTNPNKVNPIREAELEREIEAATDAHQEAVRKAGDTNKAWNQERDKNEPSKVKGYRASLARCTHLRQIFDPWHMDANSRDKVAAKPNEQHDANEKLHATHLHITVDEPKLIKKS